MEVQDWPIRSPASSPAAGQGPGCPVGSIPAAPCADGPVPGIDNVMLDGFDVIDIDLPCVQCWIDYLFTDEAFPILS